MSAPATNKIGVQNNCPRCGKAIPADAPGGVCPACLVKFCLESDETDDGAGESAPESNGGGEEPPIALPDYEVLEEIGRGGMGIVYRARHLALHRVVALKMLTPARLLSQKDLDRFQTEAGAVAKLDHPNILPIYEFGRRSGWCYYTMRLAEGGNLAEAIKAGRFTRCGSAPERERQENIARLTATLARAVEHAHRHGILHRDLKPANILLDGAGNPFVADFGLAKLSEGGADLTQSAAALGTPAYMAPEQAEGGARHLTAQADVYGLGLILYELLTGRRAFDSENPLEALRRIREEEPPMPRFLDPLIDSDLEILCLKCLEKNPKDRLGSAGELAEELDRWLRREPIRSRRATTWERLAKWFRREPVVASLLAGFMVTVIVGAAISLRLAARARSAALQAARMNTKFELQIAEDMLDGGEGAAGIAYLADVLKRDPANTPAADRLVSALSWRGFCIPWLSLPHADMVKAVHFSPDGRRLASVTGDHAFIWDAQTGQKLAGPMTGGGAIHEAAFSPDSKWLATAVTNGLRLWDAANGALLKSYDCQADIDGVHFSPDGQSLLACGSVSNAWLFDVASAQPAYPPVKTAGVWRAAFSADGSLIAVGCEDGTAVVWERATGRIRSRLPHGGAVYACEFAPGGAELLTAGDDGFPRLWNLSSAAVRASAAISTGPILHAKFSPDGSRFATAGADGRAWLWDAKTCRRIIGPMKHLGTVFYVNFSPDGRRLVTCSVDKTARVWDTATGEALTEPLQCPDEVREAEFSPDGRWLVTRSLATNAIVWFLKPHENFDAMVSLPARTRRGVISRDDHYAAVLGYPDGLWIWNLRGRNPPVPAADVHYMAQPVVFAPSGDQVLGGAPDGGVCLWDAVTGRLLRTARLHDEKINSIRFSRDGTRMISASGNRIAKVWEYPSFRLLATLAHSNALHDGDFGPIRDGDLSPDGRLAATVSWDRSAWIWDATTGRLLRGPLRHDHTLQHVRFSSDGRMMITYSQDQIEQAWDVETGAPIGTARAAQIGISESSFSGQRMRVIMSAHDQFAYVCDSETGRSLSEPIHRDVPIDWVAMSEDGAIALCGASDGVVSARRIPSIPLPAPEWVPPLAEAICGRRIGESGTPELLQDRSAATRRPEHPDGGEEAWFLWRRRLLDLESPTHTRAGDIERDWPITIKN